MEAPPPSGTVPQPEGGDDMDVSNMTSIWEDSTLLQIWLTRLLVTAIIIVVLEYTGWAPNQMPTRPPTVSNVMQTMQYTDMTATADSDKDGDSKTESKKNGSSDKKAVNVAAVSSLLKQQQQQSDNNKDSLDNNNKEEEGNDQEDAILQEEAQNAASEEDEEEKEEEEEELAQTTNGNASNTTDSTPKVPKFRNTSKYHPGMEAFQRWYDIETSLFRQYNVGRTDGVDVIPPYVPKSRGGQVRVALKVTNQFTVGHQQHIVVNWMNYQGHEEFKGNIYRGETWYQTTWVEHPWVFRLSDTDELILHYIPERVIPHLDEAPTVDPQKPMIGVQQLIITRPTPEASRDHLICSIVDTVMPHPASHHFTNPNAAHAWTLTHMKRMQYFDYQPDAALLQKYLTNILLNPNDPSKRQIRIANKSFHSQIWQSTARGLLLAAGFQEQHAYAELGTAEPLSTELVEQVSLLLKCLQSYCAQLQEETSNNTTEQPEGADGSGRAGFGRAGEMNFRR